MIAEGAWSNLVAAAIGASAVLAANWLGERRESERDRKHDARKLRDAKADRIRTDSVILAVAADAYEGVGKQLAVLWAGDTKEARAERLNPMLTKATDGLVPAVMRLQTETGTEAVVETYKAVLKAFVGFKVGAEMMEQHPGTYSAKDMAGHLQTLESGVTTILAGARTRLAELEKPL